MNNIHLKQWHEYTTQQYADQFDVVIYMHFKNNTNGVFIYFKTTGSREIVFKDEYVDWALIVNKDAFKLASMCNLTSLDMRSYQQLQYYLIDTQYVAPMSITPKLHLKFNNTSNTHNWEGWSLRL